MFTNLLINRRVRSRDDRCVLLRAGSNGVVGVAARLTFRIRWPAQYQGRAQFMRQKKRKLARQEFVLVAAAREWLWAVTKNFVIVQVPLSNLRRDPCCTPARCNLRFCDFGARLALGEQRSIDELFNLAGRGRRPLVGEIACHVRFYLPRCFQRIVLLSRTEPAGSVREGLRTRSTR